MMHLLRKYDVAPLRSAMRRCLPPNVAKPRIIREANIIRRSRYHLPKANIIQKRNFCLVDKSSFFVGGEREIRTLGKAEVDVFLEFSCFFYDPMDGGILI